MKIALPMLMMCAACSPAGGGDGNAAESARQGYATQSTAPSPDYRALLARPAAGGGGTQRAATAPLPADARATGDAWLERLRARGALLGYGLAGKGPDGPVDLIDTGLTEQAFDRWAAENGWRVPGHIRWSFVPEMTLPPVGAAAAKSVRIWPASTARTGAQNQALLSGRVELRDGCFFVGEPGKPADRLAWFHAETGFDIDPAGYFILRDRVSGQTLARLGEEMNWGGPASAEIGKDAERALRKACGDAEIYVVGSPQSRERFLTQYPHLRTPQTPPPPPPTSR